LYSQISLIGARTNQVSGIDIITWDALDSSFVNEYSTDLTGYYLASSVFDAYNGNYYLAAFTDQEAGLFSFNVKTLKQDIAPFFNYSNITEFDMSTGKIYNLTVDSLEYFSVNEYNIEQGTDSLLGVVYEPGTNGIIVDAIAFNSNDGILYYMGYDSSANTILYSIPVRNEEFTYTKTIIVANDSLSNYFSLNYDNVNDKLFALNNVFNPMGNITGTNLVEIDVFTGEVILRGLLSEFIGFVMGTSAFDQNSGSYLVSAIDTNYNEKLIIFNTNTNTYSYGYSPGGVSEIACDNTAFATATYITTSVSENIASSSYQLYPNPAGEYFQVFSEDLHDEMLNIQLYDITGKKVLEKKITSPESGMIGIGWLDTGIYIVKINSDRGSQTIKLIKQ